jgi:hypothetical protein
LVLQYADKTYRVLPRFFASVPTPKFDFGERVKDLPLNRVGVVKGICWHSKRKEEYYLITINDRMSSRWYFRDELEAITKSE